MANMFDTQPVEIPNVLGTYMGVKNFQAQQEDRQLNQLATMSKIGSQGREQELKKFQTLSQLVGSVNDDASYQQARGIALRLYPELAQQLPSQYDPDTVNRWKWQFTTAEKKMGLEMNQYTNPIDTYMGPQVWDKLNRQFVGGAGPAVPASGPPVGAMPRSGGVRAPRQNTDQALIAEIQKQIPGTQVNVVDGSIVPPDGMDAATFKEKAAGIAKTMGLGAEISGGEPLDPLDPTGYVNENGEVNFTAINQNVPVGSKANKDVTDRAIELAKDKRKSMGKPGLQTIGAKSQAEKKMMEIEDGYAEITRIAESFDPKYLEVIPRLSTEWSNLKEKWGGELNESEKKSVREFSQFRRKAISAINNYIKRITGAQMSEKEAERLIKAMPNPGQGLLDGDGPTQFKAKMDDVMQELKLARARYSYYIKSGLTSEEATELINSDKAISTEQIPGVMAQREQEIEEELTQQGLTGSELENEVESQLREEFGL